MKKILSKISAGILGLLLLCSTAKSQVFKATAYFGSTPTSIIIVLKPDFGFNAKLNEVGFAIQVPKVINGTPITMPTITVLNNFLSTTFDTWVQVSEAASDANFYNFKFGKTALSTAPVLNVPSGTELKVIELQISAPAVAIPLTRLAHLASNGPNNQYGVYFLDGSLVDRTNYVQMFYGPVVVPAAPVANDNLGYETYQYVFPSASPLPVKFLGFNVTKKNGDAVLAWQIANESAITERYEIERTLNGVDFKKVYTVAAKNNGNSSNSYTITDLNLSSVRSSGIFYYRIKQIDKNGDFVYSETRSIRLNTNGIAIGVYPNPVKDFANVTIDLEQDVDGTITVTDASGKQVQYVQTQLFKGPNIKKINMANFAAGSYLLKVTTSREIKTMAIVKAN